MKFIIDHGGVSREIETPLSITGARLDIQRLAKELHRLTEEPDWVRGTVMIHDAVPPPTHLRKWDE